MEWRFAISLGTGCVIALAALANVFPAGPSAPRMAADSAPFPSNAPPLAAAEADEETLPPLRQFTDSVNRNMFSSAPAPFSRSRTKGAGINGPKPAQRTEVPPVTVEGLVYTGMGRIGTAVLALVEETRSSHGRFVRVGEELGGGRVVAISDDNVAIRIQGRLQRLTRQKNYSLVPLSQSAAFLTAKSVPPAIPQPAAPISPSQPAAPSAPQALPISTPVESIPASPPMSEAQASPVEPEQRDTRVPAIKSP